MAEILAMENFHLHSCSECKETMKHWSRDRCLLPEVIKCETCKAPKKDTIEDYEKRGFRADESVDQD